MRTGILLGAAAGACWGLMFVAPVVLSAFTPLEIAAGRFAVYGLASLLLLSPALVTVWQRLSGRDLLLLLLLAACGSVVFYILLSAAIQRVGVAPAGLIMGLVPLVVTLWGRNDEGAVPLARLVWPLAMVLLGILCINLDAMDATLAAGLTWLEAAGGLMLGFAALFSWSLYAVLNARALKHRQQITSQQWSHLVGIACGLLALGLLGYNHLLAEPVAVSQARDWTLFWGISVVIGITGSVVANILWNGASRRLPLTLTGQVFVFEPLFALIYGFAYAGRWPRPLETLAMVLLLGGVAWAVARHAEKPVPGDAAERG